MVNPGSVELSLYLVQIGSTVKEDGCADRRRDGHVWLIISFIYICANKKDVIANRQPDCSQKSFPLLFFELFREFYCTKMQTVLVIFMFESKFEQQPSKERPTYALGIRRTICCDVLVAMVNDIIR